MPSLPRALAFLALSVCPRSSIGRRKIHRKISALDLARGKAGSLEVSEGRGGADGTDGTAHSTPHSLSKMINNEIIFATLATQTKGPEHRLPGPEGWDFTLKNFGEGLKWHGAETKMTAAPKFLASIPDDQLVVLMDGGDIVYGGCDLAHLKKRYEDLCKVLNVSIIASAEAACIPETKEICDSLGAVRSKQERARVLPEILNMTPEQFDVMTEEVATYNYQNLNSGFLMGKAKDLRVLADLQLEYFHNDPKSSNDQTTAMYTWLDRPDLVGLDYTAYLSTSLLGIKFDTFAFENGKWWNKVTKEEVCFLHFAGFAKGRQRELTDLMHMDA